MKHGLVYNSQTASHSVSSVHALMQFTSSEVFLSVLCHRLIPYQLSTSRLRLQWDYRRATQSANWRRFRSSDYDHERSIYQFSNDTVDSSDSRKLIWYIETYCAHPRTHYSAACIVKWAESDACSLTGRRLSLTTCMTCVVTEERRRWRGYRILCNVCMWTSMHGAVAVKSRMVNNELQRTPQRAIIDAQCFRWYAKCQQQRLVVIRALYASSALTRPRYMRRRLHDRSGAAAVSLWHFDRFARLSQAYIYNGALAICRVKPRVKFVVETRRPVDYT